MREPRPMSPYLQAFFAGNGRTTTKSVLRHHVIQSLEQCEFVLMADHFDYPDMFDMRRDAEGFIDRLAARLGIV